MTGHLGNSGFVTQCHLETAWIDGNCHPASRLSSFASTFGTRGVNRR